MSRKNKAGWFNSTRTVNRSSAWTPTKDEFVTLPVLKSSPFFT